MSKKIDAKQKLMEKLFAAVVAADFETKRREYQGGGRYRNHLREDVDLVLPGNLMHEVQKHVSKMPGVTLTVKVAPKDLVKIKTSAADSCMTAATKKSIAAAIAKVK